jgi:signal transduction histidine kinase
VTRRLILSYLLVAAFVLVVVEVPLGLAYAGRAEDRLFTAIERDARVLAGLLHERIETGDAEAAAAMTEDYTSQSSARVVVTDAAGLSLVDTSEPDAEPRDFSTRPEFATALGGSQHMGIRYSDTLGEELAVVAVPIASDAAVAGAVRVSFTTETMRAQIRDNWLRLGLLAALVLLAAASFGWLMARWAMSPVEALETGAERLAAGDLSGRAEVDRGPPELRHLAETFNGMAARLETLVDSQKAFVADASHQLRTPLTALRLRIDSLQESHVPAESAAPPGVGATPGSIDDDLVAVGDELDRLMGLVEGLLAMARSGTDAVIDVVDVSAAAHSAADRWDALAAEHSVDLRVDAPSGFTARIVNGGVEQVLDNLIDNAIGVAPPGSAIEIAVTAGTRGVGHEDVRDSKEVHLGVRDHGPGLDEADRARAIDRFWRAPGAPGGGTGLGLAIVAELARTSGGGIKLREPATGPGLLVDVWFPAASPAGHS